MILKRKDNDFILKKQSSGGVLSKRCFLKLRKIHRKALVLESHFNKFEGLRERLQHSCFPMNFVKVLRKSIFCERLFLLYVMPGQALCDV